MYRRNKISNILVAYFSASGVTKALAERLAGAIGADALEIKPKTPYTQADLDWTNSKSRSSVEMKNKSIRPEMAPIDVDLSGYDAVFVGFPIWWYVAPTIINTFLESADFSGKLIIPFATSGGSGMGNTVQELAPSCPGARVLKGKRFSAGAGADELKRWAQGCLKK